MTDLLRQLQAALLLAADTVDLWRRPVALCFAVVFVASLWIVSQAWENE